MARGALDVEIAVGEFVDGFSSATTHPSRDQEASVWSGHCDDIPAAADAPTLDELLEKISAMALDLLPDNHPDVAPEQLFLRITALREAEPAAS